MDDVKSLDWLFFFHFPLFHVIELRESLDATPTSEQESFWPARNRYFLHSPIAFFYGFHL